MNAFLLLVSNPLTYVAYISPYINNRDGPAPIQWVSTILRLGQKYQVDFIVTEAVRRLNQECPTKASHSFISGITRTNSSISDHKHGGMGITIVNLARQFNLRHLLPYALYLCSKLTVEQLVNGIILEDESRERLSPNDLIACLKGRDQLLDQAVWIVQQLDNCRTSGECTLQESIAQDAEVMDWLASRPPFLDTELTFRHDAECDSCEVECTDLLRNIRFSVFRNLPSIFNVAKDWNELRAR